MNISDVNSSLNISQAFSNLCSYSKTTNSSSNTTIEDSYEQSDDSQKFKSIVSQYDLNNISSQQLEKMSSELYNNNLITKDEKTTLDSAADCPIKSLNIKKGPRGEYVDAQDLLHPETVERDYSKLWEEVEKDATEGSQYSKEAKDVNRLFAKIEYYKNS